MLRILWAGLGLSLPLLAAPTAPVPPPPGSAPLAEAPRLAQPKLPARGWQQTRLDVPRFGRYSLRVKTAQGMALQLLDAMAGPTEWAGSPGVEDGRLDLFLDQGTYKLRLQGHAEASGEASLSILPFTERSSSPAPLLVEEKLVRDDLKDLEQRSYWVVVAEAQQVVLEAAGRSLADLRLWADGSWLVDAQPECQVSSPTSGQPLLHCGLTAHLEPGNYLLTAYGGLELPWAVTSTEHPLYLRSGIPFLSTQGRRGFVVSPFGVDRYLLPENARMVRLELPSAAPATLGLSEWREENPFAEDESQVFVEKDSAPPVVSLWGGDTDSGANQVTVRAAAGSSYVLQYFAPSSGPFTLTDSLERWLSTVHAGFVGDEVDVTGVVTRRLQRGPEQVVTALGIPVGPAKGWTRRCNLQAPLRVLLEVAEGGNYQVETEGPKARHRIEPFLTSHPQGYKVPDLKASGGTWALERGLNVLQVYPDEQGIVTLRVKPEGLSTPLTEQPVRASLRLGALKATKGEVWRLHVFGADRVPFALVQRALPIDLGAEPLPLTQAPGESLAIPVQVKAPGTLKAITEDGSSVLVSVDGQRFARSLPVKPGTFQVSLRLEGNSSLAYSLLLEPAGMAEDDPLPLPDPAVTSAPPALAALLAGKALPLDLEEDGQETVGLSVSAPALYRIESTGLLATAGAVRTRTNPTLARRQANGMGRNFLLQEYLRPGDYQITVRALHASKGHLTLRAQPSPVEDLGRLAPGSPVRTTLPPGKAVSYTFQVPVEGRYRLTSLGVDRRFPMRLEDADGYALTNGPASSGQVLRLPPGEYRVVLLPGSTESRRLTLVERVEEAVERKGHGPHSLPLAARGSLEWLEPEGTAPRDADVWTFRVPAPLEAAIELTAGMVASLSKVAENGSLTAVAAVPADKGWRGRLEPGDYRLQATSGRINSRVRYDVAVWPVELVPGLEQSVQAPASLPLSVGQPGLYALSSLGAADVRARLYDARGKLLASNDDRPGDWNFQLFLRLTEGMYRLEVQPVGREKALTRVRLTARDEVVAEPLNLPARKALVPGREVSIFPLKPPEGAETLLASVSGAESVGLALEVAAGEGWRSVAEDRGRTPHLEVPLAAGGKLAEGRYRLRVWSEDERYLPLTLTVAAVQAPRGPESRLAAGLGLAAVSGLEPAVSLLAVEVASPGLYRLDSVPEGLRWCPGPEVACRPVEGGLVAVSGRQLVFTGAGSGQVVKAARVSLEPGKTLRAPLPADVPLTVGLDPEARGPQLVKAEATAGLAGVSLRVPGESMEPTGLGLGVGRRQSVALHPELKLEAVAQAWQAQPGVERAEVSLTLLSYPPARTEEAGLGVLEGLLPVLSAQRLNLPAGPKQLSLTLGAGLAVALLEGTQVQGLYLADGAPLQLNLETTAGALLLLNTAPEGARAWRMVLMPVVRGKLREPVSYGVPFEEQPGDAGVTVFEVSALKGPGQWRLHVGGATEELTVVSRDGQVQRGRDVPLASSGGQVLLRHGPGLSLAWVDRPGLEATALFGTPLTAGASAVKLPVTLRLEGESHALRVVPDQPSLLEVRVDSPVVILVQRTEGASEVRVLEQPGRIATWIPASGASLKLRPLQGKVLQGHATLVGTPAVPLGEGLGPETLLEAGGTRIFSFQLERAGLVGVGARAGVAPVTCRLLGLDGHFVGEGLTQLQPLEPGTWLLALSLPADATPVSVRPVVLGLKAGGDQPSKETLEHYARLTQDGEVSLIPPAPTPVEAARWALRPLEEGLVDPLSRERAQPTVWDRAQAEPSWDESEDGGDPEGEDSEGGGSEDGEGEGGSEEGGE